MSKSEGPEFTANIGATVTPEQKHELRIRAAEEDMTMSEYVRSVLFNDD
jgi:hypothetical protein